MAVVDDVDKLEETIAIQELGCELFFLDAVSETEPNREAYKFSLG